MTLRRHYPMRNRETCSAELDYYLEPPYGPTVQAEVWVRYRAISLFAGGGGIDCGLWSSPLEVVRTDVWFQAIGGETMPTKRHKPEEVVVKFRQVDVLVGQGKTVADAVRAIGVTQVTYGRWRQEYGGLKLDQVKRMKELEQENQRLRRAVSDLTLDKLILKEAAKGNF
jgi:transposase-like protein